MLQTYDTPQKHGESIPRKKVAQLILFLALPHPVADLVDYVCRWLTHKLLKLTCSGWYTLTVSSKQSITATQIDWYFPSQNNIPQKD
jgi:hypothetical protein